MLKINKSKFVRRSSLRGDTIIEVLIAIAIAGFAIGTAYAIANRSLQQAITARERNQAVNILQGQIAALKLRFIGDGCTFSDSSAANCAFGTDTASSGGFVVPAGTLPTTFPYTAFHFCIDDQSASPTDTTHSWNRIDEGLLFTDADANNISPTTNKYNPGCIHKNAGSVADFFVDISAQITASSQNLKRRTVYKFSIRWEQVGGAGVAQSDVYYRLGANNGSGMGSVPTCPVGTTGTPPNCVPLPTCPVGTTGTPPNCVPISPPICTIDKTVNFGTTDWDSGTQFGGKEVLNDGYTKTPAGPVIDGITPYAHLYLPSRTFSVFPSLCVSQVVITTHDQSLTRSLDHQPAEQVNLDLLDGSGTVLATLGPTTELPDGVNSASQTDTYNIPLTSSKVSQIRIWHDTTGVTQNSDEAGTITLTGKQ